VTFREERLREFIMVHDKDENALKIDFPARGNLNFQRKKLKGQISDAGPRFISHVFMIKVGVFSIKVGIFETVIVSNFSSTETLIKRTEFR
jgi:hypothetical protein